MPLNKITIVLFPNDKNTVRQFTLPKIVLPLCAIVFFLFVAAFFWAFQNYTSIKSTLPNVTKLENENQYQKEQFLYLAKKIDNMTEKVEGLERFNHKLKVMANLVGEEGERNASKGIGGPTQLLSESSSGPGKGHRKLVQEMHRSLHNLDREIEVSALKKNQLYKILENQKMLLASTPSIWPAKGWVSSGFGYRKSPFTGKKEFHRGIDISTRLKSKVLVPAQGVVKSLNWEPGYGKVMTISHGYGLVTRYGHLSKFIAKKDQNVKRGDIIGLVGNTGQSTGPHLHYEVHLNNVAVNPRNYLPE